jgi:hypothetical protein
VWHLLHWWSLLPAWVKPIVLVSAIGLTVWLATQAIPMIVSYFKQKGERGTQRHFEMCERAVLSAMRFNMASEVPMEVAEISRKSGISIEDAGHVLTVLAEQGQVHYWNGRWRLGPLPNFDNWRGSSRRS